MGIDSEPVGLAEGLIDSPMLRTVSGRATDYWNDSCALDDLRYAIDRGATGATSNPSIVLEVLRREREHWHPRIIELAHAEPAWTETDLTWAIVEEMAIRGAKVLEPVFVRDDGPAWPAVAPDEPGEPSERRPHARAGSPLRDARLEHAGQVPRDACRHRGDRGGHGRGHQHQRHGVVHRAAGDRGRRGGRARARGVRGRRGDPTTVTPVCTIMIGRLDDWVRVVADRDGIAVDPDAMDWAGIAVFKRSYAIYQERGFRTRLLAAAYRHRLHWTELVGGDVILTMPHAWQVRFNASGIAPEDRIEVPVDPALIGDLLERVPDFGRAYEPDGLTIEAFDRFGPTVRTLRTFISSYHELVGAVRDVVLPDPDVKTA